MFCAGILNALHNVSQFADFDGGTDKARSVKFEHVLKTH